MTSPFERATRIEKASDGSFRANVPEGWQQAKGVFGGVVVGILTRAIVAAEDDAARSLRSLSASLCAPLMPGEAAVTVTSLRRGGSMSFVEARIVQEGVLVAHASAALAAPRAVEPLVIAPPSPPRVPWSDVPAAPVEPPLGPVFAKHYEYRSTGPLPFGGGNDPGAEGWIREKVAPSVVDEAVVAGLLDAFWPTSLALASRPRPTVTVGYTMQLLVDPRSLAPAEPLFYRARGVSSFDNFFVEMRELWSGARIVAMNQQTFAILG